MKAKRGQNEESKKNLKKGKRFSKNNQPSPQAKSEGRKKAYAEKKELEKTITILTRLLLNNISNSKGEVLTTHEAMILALIKKALLGDIKAIILILSLLGDMPKDSENTNNGESTKEAFLNYLKGNRPNAD